MTDADVEKVARASFEARIAFSIGHGEGRREHFIQFEQLPTDGRECEMAVARAALDASPISRLEAEVEDLTKERDGWKHDFGRMQEMAAATLDNQLAAESERDQLAAEVAKLRRLVQAAITGLREWYGTDIFHGIESDCPEIAALVDALSSPKEERR